MVVQFDFYPVKQKLFSWSATPYYKRGDNALACIKEMNRNVVTPAFILRRMALSSDVELRMAVADHLNTPVEVLMRLVKDDNPDVRYALAENHNINRDVLNKLLDDSNPYVADRAERTLSRLGTVDAISYISGVAA